MTASSPSVQLTRPERTEQQQLLTDTRTLLTLPNGAAVLTRLLDSSPRQETKR